MKKKTKAILSLLGVCSLFSAQAARADVACTGPVYEVHVSTAGAVLVRFGSYNSIQFCSIAGNTPAPNTVVTKETCQGIMTLALTAKGTGKDFGVIISASSCSSLPSGSSVWPANQPYDFYLAN